MKIKLFKKIAIAVLSVLLATSIAFSQTVDKQKTLTFAWEQEISSDFAGWTLYKSNLSGEGYTKVIDIEYVSGQTQPYEMDVVMTFPDGQENRVYFVMTARDVDGNESEFSNEVSTIIDFKSPNSPVRLIIKVGNNP